MSAFSDAASNLAARNYTGGTPCSMGVAIGGLDAESAADVERRLWGTPDERWPDTKVSETLRVMGVRVSYQQVGHHRRRACRCFP